MIVFFIGFMGSGKSYTASAVAGLLHVPCMDLDAEIEKKECRTIGEIFSQSGEEYFRRIESATLHKLVENVEKLAKKVTVDFNSDHPKNNILAIISCGGGTPCFHGNMAWMNQRGLTVWMDPPQDVLIQRLKGEKEKRPLIASMDDHELTSYINEKLCERESYYSKAKCKIADPELTTDQILKAILDAQEFL